MSLGLLFDDYMDNQEERPRTYVGASEIGYCERMIVYKRLHGALDKDVRLKRILTLGTWFHEKFIADVLPKLKNYWNLKNAVDDQGNPQTIEIIKSEEHDDTEVTVDGLSGHFDFMYKYVESGVTVVVDLKTINSQALNYVKADGLKDKMHYVKQLEVYIEATGADYGEIWFVDKTNFELHVERVDANPTSVAESVAKHKRILKHIADGTLPEKEFKNPTESWMCNPDYCPSRAICWGIEGMTPCVNSDVAKVKKLVNRYQKCKALISKLNNIIAGLVYSLAAEVDINQAEIKETAKSKKKKYNYQITPELTLVFSETKDGLSMSIIDKK